MGSSFVCTPTVVAVETTRLLLFSAIGLVRVGISIAVIMCARTIVTEGAPQVRNVKFGLSLNFLFSAPASAYNM